MKNVTLSGYCQVMTQIKSSSDQRYTTQFNAQWEAIPVMNPEEGPSARCGHTLTIHGAYTNQKSNSKHGKHGRLLVTFGESSLLANREYLDDMYLMDLRTLMYAKVLGSNIKQHNKPFIKNNFNPVSFVKS